MKRMACKAVFLADAGEYTKERPSVVLKSKKDVLASMFLPAAIVMIFTQVTGVVANIIDGIITSRFLGSDAYSAVALLGPLVNIILLLASFISIGGQIVCSHKVGCGERDEANAVFSFSVFFGIFIAVLFVLFSIFCPDILFRICGVSVTKRPDLYNHMLHYLHGYLIGIPAVILVQVLSPFLVMDNGKKIVSLSATILCVSDILGDFANALLFHGGIFGMGLATSVSMWLQLGVLMVHFVRKSGYFRFSVKALTVAHLKAVVQNGSLSFVKKLAIILRDIATNRINLLIAVSTAAVAAKGMQSDLNMLMFCISIGIGRTLLTISSMYYGATDRNGLKRAFSYAMKLVVAITLVVGAILFFAAPLLARIYTNDPEVLELSVFSIRCMALGLVLDGISEVYQDYLQGVQNRKMVNILCFAERFFIPVGTAFLLGMLFGTKGIMAAVAVGKAILFLLMFTYLCVRCKGIPKKAEDFMLLPEDFGGSEEDNLTAQIRTMDDVVRASELSSEFCLRHQISKRNSLLMALFVEEMAGNIVRHGNPRSGSSLCVDFRLFINDGKVCMSLRDYCDAFDPMQYYEINSSEDTVSSLGIRMVMKLAKDIRYINTFNSNCLFINLEV
jgi:Na+-driven multidrug efflux pump/anti-sigma regulatory factor (Ser/Thr protein kinase)